MNLNSIPRQHSRSDEIHIKQVRKEWRRICKIRKRESTNKTERF